jgi:hypothetical protein
MPTPVTVIADGGVVLKNPSSIGGMWAFRIRADDGSIWSEGDGIVLKSGYPHLPYISNNFTEVMAILMAMEGLPFGWKGEIRSDSRVALATCLHGKAKTWLPGRLNDLLRENRKRFVLRDIVWTLLAGHPTKAEQKRMIAGEIVKSKRGYPFDLDNVWCDEQCRVVWEREMAKKMEVEVEVPL